MAKGKSRSRGAGGRFVKSGGSRKRRYRRNPGEELIMGLNPSRGRARGYARKAYRGARGFLGNMGVGHAFKAAGAGLIGVLAASLVRRKFGASPTATGTWEWRDYLMAGLGAFGASAIAKHVFKASPQTSGNILVGGLVLIGWKLLEEKIVPQSDTLKNWIGADDQAMGWDDPMMGEGEGVYGYLPGDVYMGETGDQYVYGADGVWRPADESHRLPQAGYGEEVYGEITRAPGSLGQDVYGAEPGEGSWSGFADVVVPPGSLGGAGDPYVYAYKG